MPAAGERKRLLVFEDFHPLPHLPERKFRSSGLCRGAPPPDFWVEEAGLRERAVVLLYQKSSIFTTLIRNLRGILILFT
ncbi:hypothetical protein CH371_17080 [Leptospira wolffii]|uniref:Uncharacterized protein n=1 Tax=Leptospira wolffii TaxID=409998 RepID=A0A2M9Z7T2_9LEPT|nr:hypothetical protein CH371_17080 [Leptospira wolffii]